MASGDVPEEAHLVSEAQFTGFSDDLTTSKPPVSGDHQPVSAIPNGSERLQQSLEILPRLDVAHVEKVGFTQAVRIQNRLALSFVDRAEQCGSSERSHADTIFWNPEESDDIPLRKI